MRHRVAALVLGLLVLPNAGLRAEMAAPSGKAGSDWPCQQILVAHLSPAAMWTGPSLDGVAWKDDSEITELASKLAARRVPIEEAKAEIDAFAKAAGSDKRAKLTKLFAALFDQLDGERAQIIAGLERFGHYQKSMADRIRAENEKLQAQNIPGAPPPAAEPHPQSETDATGTNQPAPAAATPLQQLQWDLRIFEDRRRTLSYVCEVPTLIEQRLFALARQIETHLD